MAPLGGVHPQPARAIAPARRQSARPGRRDGDPERAGRLYAAQRGREHLGRVRRRHHGELARRKGTALRSCKQQDLPAPDVLRHPRRAGAYVMAAKDVLFEYLLRLGDNCLVLGHRLSEWCGHGPAIEEDLALSNVALDLIGQTQLWLGYAAEVEGRGRDADKLAYLRDAREFRNVLLVEQPNGDFAMTMARQFYFDAWHYLLLRGLAGSNDPRIAEIAAKAVKEVT